VNKFFVLSRAFPTFPPRRQPDRPVQNFRSLLPSSQDVSVLMNFLLRRPDSAKRRPPIQQYGDFPCRPFPHLALLHEKAFWSARSFRAIALVFSNEDFSDVSLFSPTCCCDSFVASFFFFPHEISFPFFSQRQNTSPHFPCEIYYFRFSSMPGD